MKKSKQNFISSTNNTVYIPHQVSSHDYPCTHSVWKYVGLEYIMDNYSLYLGLHVSIGIPGDINKSCVG